MAFPILTSDEKLASDREVTRKSSVMQFEGFPLVVEIGGRPTPIAFDVIDYIDCECVHSHQAFLVPDNYLGHIYEVGKCRTVSDIYTVYDLDGTVIERPLPAWFGQGTYTEALAGPAVAVANNGALGVHNVEDFIIGLDYVKAATVLKGED